MTRPVRLEPGTRFRRASLLILLALLVAPRGASAQSGADARGLAVLIQDIFGPRGLIVNSEALLPDGSTHSAHFNGAFQSNFHLFNIALARQLSSLPLPSPASGFTYRFDPATGTFARSTQSFGPIMADRAETIGRGKVLLSYNFQFFSFDSLDSVSLRRVPAVFTHDDFQLGGGRSDLVVTNNAIEASVAQFTGIASYGLTDRVDVSIAVPLVRTRLSVASDAVIHRLGTSAGSAVHFFADPDASGGIGDTREFAAAGSAAGIGDVLVRAKSTLVREGQRGFAAGIEVRIPSGDEGDLLGSGAWGVKPFAIMSFAYGRISPHVNIGYQWNGASLLAGDVREGRKADLPDRISLAAGLDAGVSDRLSLAFDFLADRVLDSPQLRLTTFTGTGPLGTAAFPDIAFVNRSFLMTNAAAGMKLAVAAGLLANFNLRFRIAGGGLADRLTPMLGLEYSF